MINFIVFKYCRQVKSWFVFISVSWQIVSCWLHLVLIRKTKKGHSPNATVGHLTLGANSTPDGERHWQALVNTHDVEIPQWHRLTSR